jgi:hypothetical protein
LILTFFSWPSAMVMIYCDEMKVTLLVANAKKRWWRWRRKNKKMTFFIFDVYFWIFPNKKPTHLKNLEEGNNHVAGMHDGLGRA